MTDNHFDITVDNCRYSMVLPHWETDYIQGLLAKTRQPYELSMLREMAGLVGDGDLILDVGCNIGNHSLYMASATGCRVEAFEPNPDLCEAFQKSIELNGLDGRVTLHSVGVGSRKAKAHFVNANPDNLGAQSLTLIENSDDEESYDVITLDSVTFSSIVKVMKIDVEGMELEVLRGAIELIHRDRPALFVEAKAEEDYSSILALLSSLGYRYQCTFNATPTHLFLHEFELATPEGEKKSLHFRSQLRKELQATQERLADANIKYRAASERIKLLKEELGALCESHRDGGGIKRGFNKGQSIEYEGEPSHALTKTEAGSLTGKTPIRSAHAAVLPSDTVVPFEVARAIEHHLSTQCPAVTLQFGVSAVTFCLAKEIRRSESGRLICFAGELKDPSTIKELQTTMEGGAISTIITPRLTSWPYKPPGLAIGSDYDWFSQESLDQLPLVDWVVIDRLGWEDSPLARYPALPSVLEHLAPGSELWILGAKDAQVQEVVERWCAEYLLSAELIADGLVYKVHI